MPSKYSTRRRRVFRRPRRSRYTKRRVTYKARRSRRRLTRTRVKSKSFARRVLDATSTTEVLNDAIIVGFTSATGRSVRYAQDPILDKAQHTAIQSRLNNDTVAASTSAKYYFISSYLQKQTYVNWSAAKVCMQFYYYRLRRDTNLAISSLYDNGFAADGTISSNDVNANPFMSSDFCSFCKITRVVTRWLEQGQAYTAYLSMRNKRINPDRFTSSTYIAGSVGVICVAYGDIGLDTLLSAGTTAPVSIGVKASSVIRYKELADNTVNNSSNRILQTGANSDFRYANADQGSAQTGMTDNVV